MCYYLFLKMTNEAWQFLSKAIIKKESPTFNSLHASVEKEKEKINIFLIHLSQLWAQIIGFYNFNLIAIRKKAQVTVNRYLTAYKNGHLWHFRKW